MSRRADKAGWSRKLLRWPLSAAALGHLDKFRAGDAHARKDLTPPSSSPDDADELAERLDLEFGKEGIDDKQTLKFLAMLQVFGQ